MRSDEYLDFMWPSTSGVCLSKLITLDVFFLKNDLFLQLGMFAKTISGEHPRQSSNQVPLI